MCVLIFNVRRVSFNRLDEIQPLIVSRFDAVI